ncbi:MAG TPA: hypothetical protein VGO50_05220 [Pyrinomonadaceae bacterium]|jgi:hypothetical protein|nr:hypothetical protein [Pyrinomonadaceae bacterium]
MTQDPKRELLRHLVATIAFRGRVAIREAPENFSGFSLAASVRTPGEILAHIGDLLQGSVYLLKGEMVYLNAEPLSWDEEVKRFFTAVKELDSFLASGAELAVPVEKLTQGPIADALTHVGQIVILRRAAGAPVRTEPYFTAEIIPGEIIPGEITAS